MSKAVLISIRPEWAERICYCGKTMEIRKTRPTIQPPFKCYINKTGKGNRTGVVAEFVCDAIVHLTHVGTCENDVRLVVVEPNGLIYTLNAISEVCWSSMLSPDQIEEYLQGGDGYAWHITELVAYKEPKDIRNFEGLRKTKFGYEPVVLQRSPQSWCYVAEVE